MLAAQFPNIVETQPELVVHHYTEAGVGAQAIPSRKSACPIDAATFHMPPWCELWPLDVGNIRLSRATTRFVMVKADTPAV